MIVKSVAYCSVRSLKEDRVCILSLCVVVLTVRAGVGWNGPLVLAAPVHDIVCTYHGQCEPTHYSVL